MSFFSIGLAADIRNGRKALAASAPGSAADLAAALNHAEDCLADLERAERLLEQERASAEAAHFALDRAIQSAEIEAERKAAKAERLRQDLDSGAESPGRIEAARLAWVAEEAAKAEAQEIRKAAQAARKKGGAL